MEPSANKSSADQPKGDLEHLFRQKFAEAEVMPRRNLWEQIDHELLVKQNETYRQRLVQHRWLAAACVLLMMAASVWAIGPSFWHERAMATAGKNTTTIGTGEPKQQAVALTATALPTHVHVGGTDVAATTLPAVISEKSQLATSPQTRVALVAEARSTPSYSATISSSYSAEELAFSTGSGRTYGEQLYAGQRPQTPGTAFAKHASLTDNLDNMVGDELALQRSSLAEPLMSRIASLLRAASGSGTPQRLPFDTLHKASLPAGPPMLALQDMAPERKPRSTGRLWRLSASVAAAAYNPNINFSRSGNTSNSLAYSAAPMDMQSMKNASQATLYEQAASEYRQHLESRPGLRGKLGIARPLGKRWELATGVEVAQLAAVSQFTAVTAAYSRSADAFTGSNGAYSQSLASNNSAFSRTGTSATRYRYTSAGVPVSVRYGSPKNGLSLYASLGAAVNVLLGSRTEVAGASDAGQKYSLSSSDSPYRKVLASLRGGAGARYRAPDGQWSVLVGPEAELGLTTLNADPAQRFFKRSRPYSVGLATSVEFGGTKPVVGR